MLLAACASQPGALPSPSGSPVSPPASQAPSGSPSAAVPNSAKPAGPIKVRLIEPLTGPLAARGADNVDGFKLYLASIQNRAADRQIEPLIADGGSQAATALASAKQLAGGKHVSLLMGLDSGQACSAVAEYANQRRLPLAITGDCAVENLPAGPYVTRFTHMPSGEVDTAADWAAKNGFRKAALITTDDPRGIETSDAFASAFIARGGRIVQEVHPPPGASAFTAPSPLADISVVYLPGLDAVHFLEQRPTSSKTPVLDLYAQIAAGARQSLLGDRAAGVYSLSDYLANWDAPGSRAFAKSWRAKYPERPLSDDAAAGYVAGQVLQQAIQQAAGKAEDANTLLQALYYVNTETAKGEVRLDSNHDAVASSYIYRLVKQGDGYANFLLQTYTNVGRTWDRTPRQLANFRFGAYRDKWVGMTPAKLGHAVAQRSLYQFFGSSVIR